MQRLAIRILCIALIAVYGGVSSAAAVQTKRPDDGFTPRLDKLQGLLDYIHTAEKIEVKAGPLDEQGCEYRFGHAFLRHSTFEGFEMQGRYEHYRSHRQSVVKSKFKLQREVEAALRAGEKRVFTDIAFVAEEPAEFAGAAGPVCTPFFCRLVWDPERAMWRFVEVFYASKRPNPFLFSAI